MTFLIQITSIEEFAAFAAIIRGEDIDDAKILKLTASLNKTTATLAAAEAANAPGVTHP